jgi:hypothetical protein
MDLKRKTIHFLLSPGFVSLIITGFAFYFIPFDFQKYKIEQTAKSKKVPNRETFYHDLDKDGNSEKIELHYTPRLGIIVYYGNGILDQWNFDKTFNGNFSRKQGIACHDIDNDGIDEILLSTFRDGKILLHAFSPLKNNIFFENVEVGNYRLVNDQIDTRLHFVDVYDQNNDGSKEIYFFLLSGYSIRPRSMHTYDFINYVLLSSKEGCVPFWNVKKGDIDDDGVPEFYTGSMALGNCNKQDQFSDHYSWLMVFNPEISFRFEPVKTGIYPSAFDLQQYTIKGINYYVGLQSYGGAEEIPSYISLFDGKGSLVKKQEITISPELYRSLILPKIKDDRISVLKTNGELVHFDSNLRQIEKIQISPILLPEIFKLDVDQDGYEEFIFLSAGRDQLIIAKNDFSSVTEIDYDEPIFSAKYSLKLVKGNLPELFVDGDQFNYFFTYYKNPLYFLRWLAFPGLFIVVLSATALLYRFQKVRLIRKQQAEKRLTELQLQSVKNQLDPHFALNLIASIGDLFDKKDSKLASYVFGKYSTLLRNSILNADQFTVDLSTELEFVDNYLSLEKFRFDNKFDFEIKSDGADSSIQLPKMLIHGFVENAVKHGVRNMENGKIEIIVERRKKECSIFILDNGVGREQSRTQKTYGTGKGLSIIDTIISGYNSLRNATISYVINDLTDSNGNPRGTEVKITIPSKKL